MISFIICSIHPEKLAAFQKNVAQSIEVEYEFVVIDNRTAGYSLCQAYNIGAERAKYDYLCFAHEDIEFLTGSWGRGILEQLAKPETGVIGFAGAAGKPRTLSTWSFDVAYHRVNIRETVRGKSKDMRLNPRAEHFSQVVTLDGVCLFVRKEVWRDVHFDDVVFDGFHLYDLDFTTAVAVVGYKNYVCHTVFVEHFSRGSFGAVWLHYAEKYEAKWHDRLPIYVEAQSDKRIRTNEQVTYRRMSYLMFTRQMLPVDRMKERIKKTIHFFPFRPDGYILWAKLKKYQKQFANKK